MSSISPEKRILPLPGQTSQVLDSPLCEDILPNVQPKPHLAQLETISSHFVIWWKTPALSFSYVIKTLQLLQMFLSNIKHLQCETPHRLLQLSFQLWSQVIALCLLLSSHLVDKNRHTCRQPDSRTCGRAFSFAPPPSLLLASRGLLQGESWEHMLASQAEESMSWRC